MKFYGKDVYVKYTDHCGYPYLSIGFEGKSPLPYKIDKRWFPNNQALIDLLSGLFEPHDVNKFISLNKDLFRRGPFIVIDIWKNRRYKYIVWRTTQDDEVTVKVTDINIINIPSVVYDMFPKEIKEMEDIGMNVFRTDE